MNALLANEQANELRAVRSETPWVPTVCRDGRCAWTKVPSTAAFLACPQAENSTDEGGEGGSSFSHGGLLLDRGGECECAAALCGGLGQLTSGSGEDARTHARTHARVGVIVMSLIYFVIVIHVWRASRRVRVVLPVVGVRGGERHDCVSFERAL